MYRTPKENRSKRGSPNKSKVDRAPTEGDREKKPPK